MFEELRGHGCTLRERKENQILHAADVVATGTLYSPLQFSRSTLWFFLRREGVKLMFKFFDVGLHSLDGLSLLLQYFPHRCGALRC